MGAAFRDRLGSILMLVFVAVLWGQRSYTTPFGGIFPDAVMVLLAALAVAALILSFTPYRLMKEGDEKSEEERHEERKEERYWVDLTVVVVILLLWVLLLRYLGFALAGVTGFASIAWYISGNRKDWRTAVRALIVGLVVTVAIMGIFGYLLQVPLPEGEFFG
jgi:putative tricarboxylic transport membrane protein